MQGRSLALPRRESHVRCQPRRMAVTAMLKNSADAGGFVYGTALPRAIPNTEEPSQACPYRATDWRLVANESTAGWQTFGSRKRPVSGQEMLIFDRNVHGSNDAQIPAGCGQFVKATSSSCIQIEQNRRCATPK
ncbi:hypothetical protein [Bradyrhizobium ivorense]|uniref:hypothetical protein n=1 Tax=Bradyrhizobium ivorense TaxID=2511166 RepID=UPI00155AD31C|nr:hypothetical protein [Bradyrhizobium ivorense]